MKVILYMDITANGFIAKVDGNSDWVSPEDTERFTTICRDSGVVIMGRKTFDVLNPDYLPLKEGLHVVLTTNPTLKSNNSTVTFRNQSPTEVIAWLESSNCPVAVVIGGAQTASEFMSENLIDEIYLDVEPLVFTNGIPLFHSQGDFETKLELLETKMLSKQTVQLHYRIPQ